MMIRLAVVAAICNMLPGCSSHHTGSNLSTSQSATDAEDRPSRGTLESLMEQIDAIPTTASGVAPSEIRLWVPDSLTMQGLPVPSDVAEGLVFKKLLGLNFLPDGYEQGEGGRLYRFKR